MSSLNTVPLYTIKEHFYVYKSFFFFVLLNVLVNHLTTMRKIHKSIYREIFSSYGLCSINLQVYCRIYAVVCAPVAKYLLCSSIWISIFRSYNALSLSRYYSVCIKDENDYNSSTIYFCMYIYSNYSRSLL